MSQLQELLPLAAATAPFYIGVDVGGTNVKLGLVDDNGATIATSQIPTNVPLGPDKAVGCIATTLLQLVEEAGLVMDDVGCVGLATPGTQDIPGGMMLVPHNLPGWKDFPIRDRLAAACQKTVVFANDANAAAFGEYWVGSGKDYKSVILLTLGTGLGGGIIIDGLSIDGENSHGSECGHIIIDYNDDARMCPCGQRGHVEAYCSAKALCKRTAEALEAGVASSLNKPIAAGEELTPLMIANHATAGDQLANELIMQTARYLGVSIVTLINTINPTAIVLGGAMTFGRHETELGRAFIEQVRQEIQTRGFPIPAKKTIIDYAKLGGSAGYIGAAGIARAACQPLG